jgi:AcrR family transcriptional regulator
LIGQSKSVTDGRVVRGVETRARILDATRAELALRGSDLTLDHVAARLALTKQAVLYHFPSKERLLAELMLVYMADEADAMCAAVARARSGSDAIRRFLRASLKFHLDDLVRFRLMYIRAQVVPGSKTSLTQAERVTGIYAQTSRMYGALEAKLLRDPRFPRDLNARTLAVSTHLAALGYATMAGELEGAQDNMKLPIARYADELASAIERGLAPKRRRR